MSDYVPTTEEVRIKYRLASGNGPETPDEFDRWLAEVRATALEEAADDPSLRLSGHSGVSITKLRTRAAQIRQETTA